MAVAFTRTFGDLVVDVMLDVKNDVYLLVDDLFVALLFADLLIDF